MCVPFTFKAKVLFWFFALCFVIIAGRLAIIQFQHHIKYSEACSQQNSVKVALCDISRGHIYDRHGNSLTGTFSSDRIVVLAVDDKIKAEVARSLARILGISETKLNHLLSRPGILPFPLTAHQKEAIITKKWPGITIQLVQFRYGIDSLAAHIVGHLGQLTSAYELHKLHKVSGKTYRWDDLVGRAGIELFYEPFLHYSEAPFAVSQYIDAEGRPLAGLDINIVQSNHDGGDVYLTIDAKIQRCVEKVMDNHVPKGAVVVMDVHNGDILACASRPTYKPQDIEEYLRTGEGECFFNRALGLYQPGSIFKILLAAAALEEKIVTPHSTFQCQGRDDPLIGCWLDKGHGVISFQRAFADSCNPAFAQLGLKLGAANIISYARKMGLDDQNITGFPAPPDPRQDWRLLERPFNLVNASIGQGPVLLSPVQITTLTAVIANGGYKIKPRLVKELRRGDKVVKRLSPEPGRRILSTQTVSLMQKLMTEVTTTGQGVAAYLPFWGSAGKTGSAQVGNMGSINAWFTGFFPLDKPQYAVTVLVENGISGAKTAAPIFKTIAQEVMKERMHQRKQ
ncbi:MAG: penicillin-binding protein 2 [Peptococcaceae bacterium]|nr:penicillin-binding protein 2 [Peptococcaceae bacterium]